MLNKALPIVATAALMLGQAACTHNDIARTNFHRQYRVIPVEVVGTAPAPGAPIAVDITNHTGSVIVEVNDRLDAPEIRADLIRSKHESMRGMPKTDAPGTVTAAYEGSPGPGSTLRIAGKLGSDYPTGTSLALRVRVPRCDGLSVINNGGPIVIIGTGGSVTAQNGVTTGLGGRIEFRTSQPVRDPIALITTRGAITAVIAPEGRALVELDTEDGDAFFGSAYGTLTGVRPGIRSYRGVWNEGANPFVARSADGDVKVFVKPNAEQYSTADDWMAIFTD
jgi:hypothetical protein